MQIVELPMYSGKQSYNAKDLLNCFYNALQSNNWFLKILQYYIAITTNKIYHSSNNFKTHERQLEYVQFE